MEPKDATRILELTRKWQDSQAWTSIIATARQRHLEVQTAVLAEGEERRRGWETVKTLSAEITAAHDELRELAEMVRKHAPTLLGLVPTFVFSGTQRPADSDINRWTSDLRKLEAALHRLTQEQGPPESASEGTVEQRALAVLVNHPKWTVKKIAQEIGTSREYLSSKDCPKFRAARAAIRECNISAGTKTKGGEIEAAGDDDLDFDAMDARLTNKNKR